MNFKVDKNITNIKFIDENEIKTFDYWSAVHEYSDRDGIYLAIEYSAEDDTFDNMKDGQTIYVEKEVYVGKDGDIEKQVYKYSDMNLNIKYKSNVCSEIASIYCVFSNGKSLDNSYRVLKSLL